jgi:hypothetical protein
MRSTTHSKFCFKRRTYTAQWSTPTHTIVLETLTVAHLLHKFPAFYVNNSQPLMISAPSQINPMLTPDRVIQSACSVLNALWPHQACSVLTLCHTRYLHHPTISHGAYRTLTSFRRSRCVSSALHRTATTPSSSVSYGLFLTIQHISGKNGSAGNPRTLPCRHVLNRAVYTIVVRWQSRAFIFTFSFDAS